jgi:hypothetical protein
MARPLVQMCKQHYDVQHGSWRLNFAGAGWLLAEREIPVGCDHPFLKEA